MLDPAELFEPVDVSKSGVYLDGGTIAILLVDAEGKRLPFCIDNRVFFDKREREEAGAPEQGQLLAGALSPSNEHVVRLKQGGLKECRILGLLHTYVDREYTPEQRQAMRSMWVEHVSIGPDDFALPRERAEHLRVITKAIVDLERRCEPSN